MSPACVLCADTASESGLCKPCLDSLPEAIGIRCPICALPTATSSYCGRCIRKRPRFDYVVAALEYTTPVDHLIAELKYSRNVSASRPLAHELARVLDKEPYPDIVVPMPIAPARLRERGFNQAEEIARIVCSEFGLRVSRSVARRPSAQVPQASLPWRERDKNVRDAFTCDYDVSGKTVAVVDDVLTTGASLNELAAVLRRAGANSVIGWIVARTPAER